MKIYISLIVFTIGFSFLACDDNNNNNTNTNYQNIISNIANDVILETYKDLALKTDALVNTLTILEQNPITVNLEAAKQAWRDSRIPWEQSEGFLYGPVDQQGIDPAIDSWPVNETDLEEVLNSGNVLSKAFIDGLDGTLKGFHTIEYLLFGEDGSKAVNSFTPRQFEYLKSAGQSLQGSTQLLYDSWKPNGQNFIANFLQAGEAGNSIYLSQKSVLEEIVNGMITIADEVANGKIHEPLTTQDVTFEESRFSANSKRDFADNIRSIKNAYTGNYKNSNGLGISEVVKPINATLDTKFRQQIEDAIYAIDAIQGTFTTAIFNAPHTVQNAQVKVRTLQTTLDSEILPLISAL